MHWTIKQIEYATDIVWKNADDLAPVCNSLLRRSVLAVKAVNVAAFLGRRWLDPRNNSPVGSDLKTLKTLETLETRIEGTRVKHHMGPSSIKMYNKFGVVLRLETTTNDVKFFKHRRKVDHRDGASSKQLAPIRKSIYSLGVVAELFGAANRRYLEFLSVLDDPTAGVRDVERVGRPVREAHRSHRGLTTASERSGETWSEPIGESKGRHPGGGRNLFLGDDLDLIIALARGEHTISGLRNTDLRRRLGKTSSQVSRMLRRLWLHGLIKKIGRTYKYYLTALGRRVVAAALCLREEIIIPTLAAREGTC